MTSLLVNPEISPQLLRFEQASNQNTSRWVEIRTVALKALCVLCIGIGAVATIAGVALSFMLWQSNFAIISSATTPAVASYVGPKMPLSPIPLIPGGALIALGAWGWSVLS